MLFCLLFGVGGFLHSVYTLRKKMNFSLKRRPSSFHDNRVFGGGHVRWLKVTGATSCCLIFFLSQSHPPSRLSHREGKKACRSSSNLVMQMNHSSWRHQTSVTVLCSWLEAISRIFFHRLGKGHDLNLFMTAVLEKKEGKKLLKVLLFIHDWFLYHPWCMMAHHHGHSSD